MKKISPLFRVVVLLAVGSVGFGGFGLFPDWQSALAIFILSTLGAMGVFVSSLVWNPKVRDSFGLRSVQIAIGGMMGLAACFFPGPPGELSVFVGKAGPTLVLPGWARVLLFYFAAMAAPRWWKLTWRRRRYRIDAYAWGVCTAWGLLLYLVLQVDLLHAAVMSLLLLAAQAGFSWRDRVRQRDFK